MRSPTPPPSPSSRQANFPLSDSTAAPTHLFHIHATPTSHLVSSSLNSFAAASPLPPSAEASSSSSADGARLHTAPTMLDVAPESRDEDPPSLITHRAASTHHVQHNALPSSAAASDPAQPPPPTTTTTTQRPASLPLSTAVASVLPSTQTSPGAQTPELLSTVSTLQLASEALSSIPQQDQQHASVPLAAAKLLSTLHRKNKKAPAVQSPNPGSVRSRSAATTPVPTSLLLGLKHDSLDVTANSSRATTPTRTPSGRAKRPRRDRNPATPSALPSALPSLESNDRRRSARVAQAVTASASDSPSTPNLALFGFSPYLENLVMNAKETDRRTRSGGRGIRPPVDRAPSKVKRSAAKSKSKESDPDGPDDEAKSELYRQLCIISYQLQASLDMVAPKSLAQLRAHFATPPPEDEDAKQVPSGATGLIPGTSFRPSRTTSPALGVQKSNQQPAHGRGTSMSPHPPPIVVKTEPPQSPQLAHFATQPSRQGYSPESSPEVALMHSRKPPYDDAAPQYQPYAQSGYQSRASPEAYSWSAPKVDEIADEPMSPVYRPARSSNIMSISALMSGPSHAATPKPRTPSPDLMYTPPSLTKPQPQPLFMQEWTLEDEMASQFLQACADALPKLDTTELDRLTQIAQLAAFDLLSTPSSPQPSTPASPERTEQERRDASAKFDPKRLNPLETLDTQGLYAREEAEYLDEISANQELYETIRYLSSFDEVVDEWRAGELARLRLRLEMRKGEVGRIWTCDRKLAWSTYVNDRAGELYRKAAFEARHRRWEAEKEIDLLAVHKRRTRGWRKLVQDIWAPAEVAEMQREEVREVYVKFGRFLASARYADEGDPLVRADVRKIREALRTQKPRQTGGAAEDKLLGQQSEEGPAQGDGEEVVAEAGAADAAHVASSYSSDSGEGEEEDYDSDSSYASSYSSSGISSLPSFSSVYSSPLVQSSADADPTAFDLDGVASEAVAARDDDSDDSEDADESLWARRMRLANEAAVSRMQTPEALASVEPSRAASPTTSMKGQAQIEKQRGRKRRKKPPPPGARLWKKGKVQQDADSGGRDEHEETQPLPPPPASAPAPPRGQEDMYRDRNGYASATGARAAKMHDLNGDSGTNAGLGGPERVEHEHRGYYHREPSYRHTPSYLGGGGAAEADAGSGAAYPYDRLAAGNDIYSRNSGYPSPYAPPPPRPGPASNFSYEAMDVDYPTAYTDGRYPGRTPPPPAIQMERLAHDQQQPLLYHPHSYPHHAAYPPPPPPSQPSQPSRPQWPY